ncbi:MAG: ABC transporter ATP-binding protein [Elusimicrobiota bacterium]
MLEIKNLSKNFGGLIACDNFNFNFDGSYILGIIGPNGAGKTTLFNLISGCYVPDAGKIFFEGKNITDLPPQKRVKLGMARTFQTIRLFNEMTSLDNVKTGRHLHSKLELLPAILRTPAFKIEETEIKRDATEILEFLDLADYAESIVRNLPYGIKRKVEIARALATEPRLLLLDEPTCGMNPREADELKKTIIKLHTRDVKMIIIEHRMDFIMAVANRLIAMDFGEIISEGSPTEIQANERVIEAYLGKKHNA